VLPLKYADRFKSAGINVNDPRFGAWWEKHGHLGKARRYNDKWGEYLEPGRSQQEIMNFGRKMSQDNGLTIYFQDFPRV
jgi:hypothetical protein